MKDGLQRLCRGCYNEYLREYCKSRPEASKAIAKRTHDTFHATVRGRATIIFNGVRQRSRQFGLACNLTWDWVYERLQRGECEVTGVPFSYQTKGVGRMCNNHHAPSIDRIDRTGGYTTDNCRMVTWIYNRARGAFPDEALVQMSLAIAAKYSPVVKPC